MKPKEIRTLAHDELKAKLIELRRELIKLRSQAATKTTLKNPYQIKKTKRTLARILTELNARSKKEKRMPIQAEDKKR